jgi:starch synthase (maltosyl-transferring)
MTSRLQPADPAFRQSGVGNWPERQESWWSRAVPTPANVCPMSPMSPKSTRTGRIPVVDVQPTVDCGLFPAKAVVGETFTVSATVFREGHDAVGANVVLRPTAAKTKAAAAGWTPMRLVSAGLDRWAAEVTPAIEGDWTFFVEAWDHPLGTWLHDAEIKVPAGLDVALMLEEGALLFEQAAAGAPKGVARSTFADVAVALRDTSRPDLARLSAATATVVLTLIDRHPLRRLVTRSDRLALRVESRRALYSSWYELFPRSEGAVVDPTGHKPPLSGTFATATKRLPAVAAMGFDVVYLPPIHPIGRTFRKGPNNTLDPGPFDPGVPWAIGSPEGGHDAIHPELGTLDDFDAFVARAVELGLEVALDFALNASPDHPWVTEHPEWFTTRADGTIAYSENPPKKYQDIYPINFDNDPDGIYVESLRVLRHWMAHGVRIFRVDNPHTKTVAFWERLLAEVRRTDPDVLFLAEAFTRPPMMRQLAKVGFHQSYTYFTWRTGKAELEEYLTELAGETAPYMRPNFFVNTPDILHASLQYGGPPAFKIRAVLASMLSPAWGVYAGFELFEHVAVRPGSEEYLDSEKYQLRPREWETAEAEGRSLAPYLTLLNEIRRAHPALQELRNLRFHRTESDDVLAFSKQTGSGTGSDTVIVVVNLDPHGARETLVHLDLPALGMDWADSFSVHDAMSGNTWLWGERNYVRLDPFVEPAHVLAVRR